MLIALALLPLALADETAAHRQLVSVGCDNCCFKNDCSLAFSQTSPGVCCGAHPYSERRQTGCCPMGASCVACGHIWKCSRATYVSRSGKCSMCRDDQVRECLYHRYSGGYHHGGGSSIFGMLLLILSLLALASCFFYGNREPDAVIIQNGQPMYGNQMGQMGPGGQTVVVQGGGYGGYGGGYGAGGMATGAACGFVGGMMVGEALDHGHYGGGYGGDYGGGYGGGYGGDMGGGDMGFGADQ